MKATKLHALIPAAGVGARMGAAIPKQYLPLAGEPILAHTLRKLLCLPQLSQLVVVLAAEDKYWQNIEPSLRLQAQRANGGAERAESVLAGLDLLLQNAEPDDLVLVHDAARPCVRLDDIKTLIATVRKNPSRGGLLATAVRDTMKRSDNTGQVLHTEPREQLWHALTPQLFQLRDLRDAMQRALAAGATVTDECSAMEWVGLRPQLVPGSSDNIKITQPADLELAELMLSQMGS